MLSARSAESVFHAVVLPSFDSDALVLHLEVDDAHRSHPMTEQATLSTATRVMSMAINDFGASAAAFDVAFHHSHPLDSWLSNAFVLGTKFDFHSNYYCFHQIDYRHRIPSALL